MGTIQQQIAHLETAINEARRGAWLGIEEEPKTSSIAVGEETVPHVPIERHLLNVGAKTDIDISAKSIPEKVRTLILEFGPMTTKDIEKVFRDKNWKLSEKNGSETLRIMFWKKKDTFKKLENGLYDVIN
jgi:hypothetical protein